MSETTVCITCEGWGCERCKGGPGEQGFSADEKELMQLRDRVRELEGEKAELMAYVDAAKKAAGWVTDIEPGFGFSGRPLAETVAEMRQHIRDLTAQLREAGL